MAKTTVIQNNPAAEIAGWYGTAAILVAYALVSFSVISSDTIVFQFLNLTGSLGLFMIALVKKVYQSVTINLIWGIIALVALIRIFV